MTNGIIVLCDICNNKLHENKKGDVYLLSTIKLNVTVDHKRFYNSDGMWGVFGLIPNTNRDKIETLESNGVFAVSGNTPNLTIGGDYDIEIVPSYNKKYGKGYEFVMVAAKRPSTIQEQQDYLKLMVTDKQYKEILTVYPNDLILDLMEKDEFDYTDMHGIGDKTYQRIKKYIFDNMEIQEALVKLKDLDVSFKSIQKLIDRFGSSSTLIQIVEENIYELCKISGFGFKKIDLYALNRGDDPTSSKRITAAIQYLLEQDADRGHSWISIKSAVKELEELLEIETRYIKDAIQEIDDKNKRVFKDKERLALYKNYMYEKCFLEKLVKISNQPSFTKVENIDEKIAELEKENGFEYTSEQKEAIKMAVDNNVLIINGFAGTGKTSVLKAVVNTLSDYSYMSVSLSGKAVMVLRENGLRAQTIHKTLMETINYELGEALPLRYDIIIIDEASMVNNELFYLIVEALKNGSKLIIVGDNGQLPAIGTGANFDNMIRFGNKIPRQELTMVHRQAQKSGILSVANQIREGELINSSDSEESQTYGELRDMTLIPTGKDTDIKQMVLDIAERNLDKDLFEFQVITGRVDSGELSVKNLNIEMQKVFNDIQKPHVSRGGYNYRVGDKVIQNGNNYEAKVVAMDYLFSELEEGESENVTSVFNGTLGRIVDIKFDSDNTKKDHKVHIQFENEDEIVEYTVDELTQIGLAYALTTHKVQGSSADYLVFVFDGASFMLLCREFIYTGITRAKKACIMIAENRMLHMGIKKSQGNNRRTFLRELLEK